MLSIENIRKLDTIAIRKKDFHLLQSYLLDKMQHKEDNIIFNMTPVIKHGVIEIHEENCTLLYHINFIENNKLMVEYYQLKKNKILSLLLKIEYDIINSTNTVKFTSPYFNAYYSRTKQVAFRTIEMQILSIFEYMYLNKNNLNLVKKNHNELRLELNPLKLIIRDLEHLPKGVYFIEGHNKTNKSGKSVYVKPYIKGKLKLFNAV